MKHAGKATRAALRLLYWSLFFLLALLLAAVLARLLGEFIVTIGGILVGIWLLFAVFCLYFFRDPEVPSPREPQAIVAPACGKVDVIDEVEEPVFMGGRCRRISIFMSVFDVHVQRAPVAGEVAYCQHTAGEFLNALRTDSAEHNENVLLGFLPTERPDEKMAVRLIAGAIARRIVLWVSPGDGVAQSERTSLIQFGSRCDLYLPLAYPVRAVLGQRVRAGETIVASRN